jgi:hypothetical protein
MSKEMTLILLGIFVAVLPYLGIPSDWKAPLFLIAGAVIVIIGFLLRGAMLSRGVEGSESRPFVERSPAREERRDQLAE